MNSDELRYKPTGYSYRVDMNVWAGEYPVWEWEQGARMRQLKLFTDFGINYFLDLTEDGEMPPYAPLLAIVYVAILSLYPMVVFPTVSGGLWICFVSLLEFSINLKLNCISIVLAALGAQEQL